MSVRQRIGQDRLIFAVRQPPVAPTSGAGIRAQRLLAGLAAAFDVTLVTFDHAPGTEGHVPAGEVRRAFPDVRVLSVPGLASGKRRAQVRSLASRRSWQWGRYAIPAMRTLLHETVRRDGVRVVHFDDLGTAACGPVPSTISAFAPHNVEHRIVRGIAEGQRGWRRAFAAAEWRKIRHEERRAWRAMSLCVAVSELDAEAMRAGGAQQVVLCPNGTDPVPRLPSPRRSPDEGIRLLFVGTASYRPYELGLAWFVREVLPRLRESVPATFEVVGTPPDRPVRAPGVEYRGRLPSLDEAYSRAHVVVVPVFQGSGTRLKIIEAMAHGRPVISTPLGSEGLPITAGEHHIEAASAAGFANALTVLADRISRRDEALETMLAKARQVAESLFWPAIVPGLVETYRDELERSSRI